jgi:ubiquinone/menaquinone biosynthesis C-methylase UbiE
MADPAAALAETRRVLRPGGTDARDNGEPRSETRYLSNHSLEAVLEQEQKHHNDSEEAHELSAAEQPTSHRRVTPRPGT